MWILNFDEDEDYENYEDEDYENYEEDEDYENYFMNPVVLSLLLTETQTLFKSASYFYFIDPCKVVQQGNYD